MMITTNTPNKVDAQIPAVAVMRDNWELVTALLGGTKAMRDAGVKYLPKWTGEEAEPYDARKAQATLFPAFKRTVETLAARPFSKPVTVNDDVPADIKDLLDDCDLEGRNLDQFAADQMQLALGYGFGGILVDHKRAPKNDDGTPKVLSKADEAALGLRPYFVSILPEQILGWRSETNNGEHSITMLRFKEVVEEQDGDFGVKQVAQIRVLEPGKWAVYRKVVNPDTKVVTDEWAVFESGTTTLSIVPFVPVYGDRLAFMVSKPPLLELAHLNVKHWQSQSDQDTLLHIARVPVLTIIGLEEDPQKPFTLVIGASGAVKLPAGADMKYVEHSGAAITAGKQGLDDLKEEMRQSGAELLVIKPGPTTATEVASDNAVGMCALQRITLSLQDAINEALDIMGQWMGKGDDEGGSVKLFNDFGAATLAEASALLLLGMANSGKLSNKTLISELKRRGILSPDVDYEDEVQQLETEGPPTPPVTSGAGAFGDPKGPAFKPGAGDPPQIPPKGGPPAKKPVGKPQPA
jgi:hypothetical protein